MEARVAVLEKIAETLEKRFDRIDAKLDAAAVDVAVLKERVSHLPSKGFIVTVVTVALAIAATLATIAPELQLAFGAPSSAPPMAARQRAAPAPAMMSPEDVQKSLANARAAIARGASREAVIKRLRDSGIDPSGL